MHPISPWIKKYASLIPEGKPVLDVACGGGRHSLFFLAAGHEVTAVDIDVAKISRYRDRPGLSVVQADLEQGHWPFTPSTFSGIIVVNYLWRPLFPDLCAALAAGGVLLYDTFAVGNEKFGRPRNPEHLLKQGELLEHLGGELEVIDFFEGYIDDSKPAFRQSIAARKPL